MNKIPEVFKSHPQKTLFLSLALFSTIIFGAVCLAGQQIYRSLANDPQVEVVEQVSDIIEQGVPLDSIISESQEGDLASSQSLFVMVFDKDKKPVGASAKLDGQLPTVPEGTFQTANSETGNRFTWQPKEGLRMAAILKQVGDNGYVLSAKSLKETDYRLKQMSGIIVIGWLLSLLVSALLTVLLRQTKSLTIIEETNIALSEAGELNQEPKDESYLQ